MALSVPTHDDRGRRADSPVTDIGSTLCLPGLEDVEWRVTSVVHYRGEASSQHNASAAIKGHFVAWRHHGGEYYCVDDTLSVRKCQLTGDVDDQPPLEHNQFNARLLFLCRP